MSSEKDQRKEEGPEVIKEFRPILKRSDRGREVSYRVRLLRYFAGAGSALLDIREFIRTTENPDGEFTRRGIAVSKDDLNKLIYDLGEVLSDWDRLEAESGSGAQSSSDSPTK